MAEALNSRELAAYPFLECAVLLDRARQPDSAIIWADALDLNAARWLTIADRAGHRGGLPDETIAFFDRAGRFMVEAARSLRGGADPVLVDTLIRLNLGMSEQILRAA